jgi:hypothetical protein
VQRPRPREGRPGCFATSDRNAYVLQYPGFADFLIERSCGQLTIKYCLRHKDVTELTLRHLLLDHIIPRALSGTCSDVLHGALLRLGGAGVALLGPSGSGKSTLSAALAARDAELLSDDALLLTVDGHDFKATATYPSLRLWPDSIEGLHQEYLHSSPMSGHSTKRRLSMQSTSVSQIVRLSAFFVLAGESQKFSITRLPPADSCMKLVSNCFQLDTSDQKSVCGTLENMQRIAATVPVYAIAYRRDYAALAETCREVAELCSTIVSDSVALPDEASR